MNLSMSSKWPCMTVFDRSITIQNHHSRVLFSFSAYFHRSYGRNRCFFVPYIIKKSAPSAYLWISSDEYPFILGTGNYSRYLLGRVFHHLQKPRKSNLHRRNAAFGTHSSWNKISSGSRKARSIFLLNIVTLVFASNFPIIKEVEATMDPSLFNVLRFSISAIPFLPFAIQGYNDHHTRNAGIELGLWIGLAYLTQALGLLTSDSGRASFISSLTVIIVPFLDGLFGGTVRALTWVGALLSVFGVGLLESSGSPPCVGDLLNFTSALFFGIHILRTEHILKGRKKDLLSLLSYQVLVVALMSASWFILESWFGIVDTGSPSSWKNPWDLISNLPWGSVLYTGVFSTGFCLWMEMIAMRDISATEAAIIYGLEPVWGASFAWGFLGERWNFYGWIGAFFVILGSLMVQILG